MKYLILTLIILSFGLLNAEKVDITPLTGRVISNQPDGYVGTNLPTTPELSAMAKDFEAAMARRDIPTAKMIDRQMSKIRENLIPKREISPAELGNRQAGFVKQGFSGSLPFLWGNDVQIDSSNIWAFGAAGDTNGTMWCAVALRPESTIHVFRSTDHGINWSYVYWMTHGSDFRKVEVVVGSGDSNYVYVFYIRRTAGGDLWCFRIKTDLSGHNFYPVAVGPDTIDDFSVSIDYVDWYYLYCIYANEHRTGLTSHITRSLDMGATWETPVDWWNAWDPCVSYTTGSTIHCAWRYALTGGEIHYSFNRHYGMSGYWSPYRVVNDTSADQCLDPVVVQADSSPESQAAVWVFYTAGQRDSAMRDLHYSASANGGGSWTPGPPLGELFRDEQQACLAADPAGPNDYVSLCYSSGNLHRGDTVSAWWTCTNSGDLDGWLNPVKVSRFPLAALAPKLVYAPHAPMRLPGVFYSQQAEAGPWGVRFAAPWLAGDSSVDDPTEPVTWPNPSTGPVRLSATVTKPGRYSLAVYDAAGRLVASLFDRWLEPGPQFWTWDRKSQAGKTIPAGTYFVRLKGPGARSTRRLVLL